MKVPTDLKLNPKDIEERGILRDGQDNTIRSRVGVMVSIYFLEGWRKEKREALLANLGDYTAQFARHLTHYQCSSVKRYKKWDQKDIPQVIWDDMDASEKETFYFSMRHLDSKETDDPELYRIFAFGFDAIDKGRQLSGLKAHFPPSFVFEDPNRFIKLIQTWSQRLGAVHGSAGLGALSVPGWELDNAYYYPWLIQYPALEYDAMGLYFNATENGGYQHPRSSNWLTILGKENVAELGGAASISEQIIRGMGFIEDKNGGVVIRASDLPALGDKASGGIPEGYKVAAKIIKPIRFEGYKWNVIKLPSSFGTNREVRLAETLNWIRRFD